MLWIITRIVIINRIYQVSFVAVIFYDASGNQLKVTV